MGAHGRHDLKDSTPGRRTRFGLRQASRSFLLALGLMVALSGALADLQQLGPLPAYAGATQQPNRFDPRNGASSISHPKSSAPLSTAPETPPPGSLITRPAHVTMKAGTAAIDPTAGAHFKGNDGRFEIVVPPGAVSPADLSAAGGQLNLVVQQIAPPSGGSGGGSGHYSFGTFLVQTTDSLKREWKQPLRKPLTFKLHLSRREMALDLRSAVMVFNGPFPVTTNFNPDSAGVAIPAAQAHLGPSKTFKATYTQGDTTLSAAAAMPTDPTVTFNTNSADATFGKPNIFSTDLSAGALTANQSIDLPAGPGGMTPPVSLLYSSANVDEQHNPQGAAPWVGEGWNLTMGSISWAEHNVAAGCSGCSANWQDSWQLNDPYGTSADLIPPNTSVTTYYDDTPYSLTATPMQWHSAPESHAKIWEYTGPNALPGESVNPPCFRVYLPNGIMEEFGCTTDSLQYYPWSSGGNYAVTQWLLDLITDPQGNQIHLTYQQDTQSYVSKSYPRDVVLQSIQWDSPSCHNAQTMCTGASWAPLMQVWFSASHSVTHVAGSSCAANGSLRCDDPSDLSGSGGLRSPLIQSTFVLNDVQVQVRPNGSASWNTLRDYQLGYEQSPPTTITDPVTGSQESAAGKLNLTQLIEVGDDGSTSLPTRTFAYTTQTNYYTDEGYTPNTAAGCGPSWNKGSSGSCVLWSQSYGGNSSYLASASNGLGLAESFSWSLAHNNTHGVNGGGASNGDPLSCNNTSVQSSYPCDEADSESWSRVVLNQESGTVNRLTQAGQGGAQTTTPVTSTTQYSYTLSYPLAAQACSNCVAGYYWGDQTDGDYLDYYNSKFMGFTQATVTQADGAVEAHKFYATQGWGVYDTTQITDLAYCGSPCHNDPWWQIGNAGHGHEYEVDFYDTNGTTLLRQTKTQYALTCPPSGVSGSPANGDGNFNGNLVAAVDLSNPIAACDIQTSQVDDYSWDGAASTVAVPHQTTTYSYDAYGRVTNETVTSNDGGANGSPTTIVHKPTYIWNDALTATSSGVTGSYLVDFPAFTDTEDASGNRYSCTYTSYDGQANASGQSNGLTLGEETRTDEYTNCGTSSNGFTPSGQISTTHSYDAYGNQVSTTDPVGNAGNASHVGCTVGSTTYSECVTYDGTYSALPTSTSNALNQTESTGYTQSAGGGFGLWPTSTTNVNNQTTTYTYDPLGRDLTEALPGETTGLTTTTLSYTVWCSGTAAQSPCAEVDQTKRLNSSATVTTRGFYDGYGQLIETRAAAPGGQDVVRYFYHDPSGHVVFESVPYFVAAYAGGSGASAYSIPDSTQPGTTTTYDGLERVTSVTDPLSNKTTKTISIVCGAPATGDAACYEQTLSVDALGHQVGGLVDALDRKNYIQRYTGNSPATYGVYATTKYSYDSQDQLTQILQPDGTSKTTYQYDMAGRKTSMSDPDTGTVSYSYDQNGNSTETVDARGAAGTVYAGYDGLDRPTWRNTSNTSTGAYATFSYDSTASGNQGVGQLTSETFAGGPNNSLSGSHTYVYDGLGQVTSSTLTVGSSSYQTRSSYDDAGNVISEVYPNGETVTTSYTGQGWLSGVSTQQGSNTTTLLSNAGYSGFGGASRQITSANLGGTTYQFSAGYDALARSTDTKISRTSDNTVLFDQSRTFDAAGNVTQANTTLPAGTDNQAFCYDEQDRLTWAGSVGTPPCTGTAISAGTLTSAQYTNSFTYDNLGRLTSGPAGSYTYGDSAHLHAATAIGSTYTAKYDAAGNMTCRAPSSSSTCAGTQTGAQLSYDNEGSLTSWQNAPNSPTSTAAFLYDNQGNRVEAQTTQGGTTTTTVYVGNLEEVATTGSSTTTTTFYYAGDTRIAVAVNGTFSYLASDGLGSADVALNASGSATASVIYAPYGTARYSNGTMPTDYGFTGQHSDAVTGLDYYNSRYYDPIAAQFTSADTILPGDGFDTWGLSRYAYVEGNPIINTDPTGHCFIICPPAAVNRITGWVGNHIVQPAQRAAHIMGETVHAAAQWTYAHAEDISTVTGTLAIATAFIPGVDVVTPALLAVSAGTGILAAHRAYRAHHYGTAALNLMTAFPGVGMVTRGTKLIRLASSLRFLRESNFIYSGNVLAKAARNVYHAFPYDLDRWILKGTVSVRKPGYIQYVRRGIYRGRLGEFQLGQRPSALAGRKNIVIVHRFFRPDKRR